MKENILCFRFLCVAVIMLSHSVLARAQSFNVDMDSAFGPPALGRGVPSPTFGAAANSPGFWNSIEVAGFGTHFLRGLDSNLTSARIVGPLGGAGGGSNLPQNTGDFALLLNDAREISNPLNFSFDGLTNGQYRIYTYAVSISVPSDGRRARVSVLESLSGFQISAGPMPGNVFIQGITHTVHDVNVTSGQIHVLIEPLDGSCDFNGIQIVAVPEPSCIFTVSSFLLLLNTTGRRRKRRCAKELRL